MMELSNKTGFVLIGVYDGGHGALDGRMATDKTRITRLRRILDR